MSAGEKNDRRRPAREALFRGLLEGEAKLSPELRRSAFQRSAALPEDLRALVTKIDQHAYKVTDEDLAALKAMYSEDQLFELIVCAAVGASDRRLGAAWAAIDGASS